MARKKKPPKAGSVSGDTAPSTMETQNFTALSALRESATPLMDACDWKALAALARTPIEMVDPADREHAVAWLARSLVLALTQGTVEEVRSLEESERDQLRAALSVLERREPLFHQGPEFDVYTCGPRQGRALGGDTLRKLAATRGGRRAG